MLRYSSAHVRFSRKVHVTEPDGKQGKVLVESHLVRSPAYEAYLLRKPDVKSRTAGVPLGGGGEGGLPPTQIEMPVRISTPFGATVPDGDIVQFMSVKNSPNYWRAVSVILQHLPITGTASNILDTVEKAKWGNPDVALSALSIGVSFAGDVLTVTPCIMWGTDKVLKLSGGATRPLR